MHIDRCICTQRTFRELVAVARAESLSLPQLAEQTGASACCGMCRPYLVCALRTGQTTFRTTLKLDPDLHDPAPVCPST